jgi:hypothetical protein
MRPADARLPGPAQTGILEASPGFVGNRHTGLIPDQSSTWLIGFPDPRRA